MLQFYEQHLCACPVLAYVTPSVLTAGRVFKEGGGEGHKKLAAARAHAGPDAA